MQKLVVGNLKMNLLTLAERDRYLESFQCELEKVSGEGCGIVLCPPAVHLEKFSQALKIKNVSIGAQNVFWEERGSFTGEISAPMVKNIGCEYAIIGHSERRKYFSESDEIVNTKIRIALQNNLIPIVCVGESAEQRKSGETSNVIAEQVKLSLVDVPLSRISDIVFAYEPIWSVGSDLIPTGDDILKVKITIKKVLVEKFGISVAEKNRIIYGGSVNSKSVSQVCLEPQMDGVLVGRESLVPSEFVKIVEIINAIRNNE